MDAACTILSLSTFYDVFKDEAYKAQMEFIYNNQIKNQQSNADLNYTIASLTLEKYFDTLSLQPVASNDAIPEVKSNVLIERFAKVSVFLALVLFAFRKFFAGETVVTETNSVAEM
jgi:hypothetical protein